MMRSILAALLGLLIGVNGSAAYPEKPLRLVVPFPAGGAGDAVARAIAPQLSQTLGQTVVVDNKPGADGQIAATEVLRAAPDGYTLFMANAGALNYVPVIRKTPPYDPAQFTPISLLGVGSSIMFVHTKVPANSLAELVDYARANPDKLSYGSTNPAAILISADFLSNTKTRMVHIPYKGDALALPDLLAGRIQLIFATPAVFMPHVLDGRLRALASTQAQRSAMFPDVPTMTEAGFSPLSFKQWTGVFGPAGMSKALADRLSREIGIVLAKPDVRAQIEKAGFAPAGSSPDELAVLSRQQLEIWKDAVRQGKFIQE